MIQKLKSRQFFKSGTSEKAEYAIHSAKAGGKNRGWVAMQGESLDPEGQKVTYPLLPHEFSALVFMPMLSQFPYPSSFY